MGDRRLGTFSGREVCSILARSGFTMVRQRGSHMVMQRQIAESTVTVPVPDHRELATGTLAAIIRQSGVARSEFER